MADAPDTKGVPKPPPHLRMSSSESEECGSCAHYKEGACGMCVLYAIPVNDEWVCDSWEKGSKPDDDTDSDEPDENESGTMSEAETRVREHAQRIRARKD